MRTKPKRAVSRGSFKSLKVSAGFRGFVLDQLSAVPELRDKAMFGGVGLYSGDLFFGLIAAEVLYFKVDDDTRAEYEAAGSSAFRPYARGAASRSYYTVPLDVVESGGADLDAWARKAIAAAARGAAKKRSRGKAARRGSA